MTRHTSLAGGFGPRWFAIGTAILGFLALPATGRAGDPQLDNSAWIPYAEYSPATTLLGRPSHVDNEEESAQTWAMHKIAVIQAASGDPLGAKNTAAEIGYQGAVGEVSGVWFLNGQPVYDRPPASLCDQSAPGFCFSPLRPGYTYEGSMVPGFCLLRNQLLVACPAGRGPRPPYVAPDLSVPAAPAALGRDARLPVGPHPAAARGPRLDSSGRDARAGRNPVHRDPSLVRVAFKLPADLPANYLAADPVHGGVVDFCDDRDRHGTRVTLRKYADGFAIIETPSAPTPPKRDRGSDRE